MDGFRTGGGSSESLLPNLIIAGVPKGGTTSLFRYLSQHPDVCSSRTKELRYFEAIRYGEPLAPLETYARNFGHCSGSRYRMESTPGYFGGGRQVAVAMRESLDAHVVVCLREPVQRCWSWYRYVRSRARIPKDMTFSAYLDTCEALHRACRDGLRENQPFTGLLGGCYDQFIDAWLESFGERLRIEFFDDLVQHPRALVEGILRWLDLDGRPLGDFRFDVENKTEQYRNRLAQRGALLVNRRAERFFERHSRAKLLLRRGYYALNRDAAVEVLPPVERKRLAAFYAPHNRRLAVALRSAGRTGWPTWLTEADRTAVRTDGVDGVAP